MEPWAESFAIPRRLGLEKISAASRELVRLSIGNKLPQDALNPAHGSLLRVNSPSHEIFSNEIFSKPWTGRSFLASLELTYGSGTLALERRWIDGYSLQKFILFPHGRCIVYIPAVGYLPALRARRVPEPHDFLTVASMISVKLSHP